MNGGGIVLEGWSINPYILSIGFMERALGIFIRLANLQRRAKFYCRYQCCCCLSILGIIHRRTVSYQSQFSFFSGVFVAAALVFLYD